MSKEIMSLGTFAGVPGDPPRLEDVQPVIAAIREVAIWADLENETALRAIVLPIGIRHVRYFDPAHGKMIAALSIDGMAPLTAFDVADTLTWHVDYRAERWTSSRIKLLEADTLELWIELVRRPAGELRG
ncbi:hypothetical protein U1763_02575 [Sphingomonas sp. LB2R24]|uniref:hypothetical protein n=1 Tax=Sphingomonas sorbitolis TaxID=3096165 RepID=UPI002FC79FFD